MTPDQFMERADRILAEAGKPPGNCTSEERQAWGIMAAGAALLAGAHVLMAAAMSELPGEER